MDDARQAIAEASGEQPVRGATTPTRAVPDLVTRDARESSSAGAANGTNGAGRDTKVDRATSADVPSIAALDAAAFPDRPWSAELWATEVAGRSWVAVVREPEADPHSGVCLAGAVPEATVAGTNVTREDVAGVIACSRADAASEVADLDRVIVRAGVRGRGVGEALVRAGLAWASEQGVTRVLLEVEHTNASARRLYERCGFASIGTRRNYYGPGRDAVVMETVVQPADAEQTGRSVSAEDAWVIHRPAVGIEDEGRRG